MLKTLWLKLKMDSEIKKQKKVKFNWRRYKHLIQENMQYNGTTGKYGLVKLYAKTENELNWKSIKCGRSDIHWSGEGYYDLCVINSKKYIIRIDQIMESEGYCVNDDQEFVSLLEIAVAN